MADDSTNLQFLKLGGSLITEKSQPHTARLQVIQRLALEIAAAYKENLDLKLVIGHGSGSFGHVPAQKYDTRRQVRTPQQWQGFVEVWHEATTLNRLVVDALYQAGLPVLSFSPLATVLAYDGRLTYWHLANLKIAFRNGLLPVIQGDVIFDMVRGGTILSTEDLFAYLVGQFHPKRVLLAGSEPGVWADFPTCQRIIPEITPGNVNEFKDVMGGSTAADVTGGMASKVQLCLQMVSMNPELEVSIFSGETPGAIKRALSGEISGTSIHNE